MERTLALTAPFRRRVADRPRMLVDGLTTVRQFSVYALSLERR